MGKHDSCRGCDYEDGGYDICNACINYDLYTPKEPEPAAPDNCEDILCKDCPLSKEPDAEPGLVSMPIEVKDHDFTGEGCQYMVHDEDAEDWLSLYVAVNCPNFHHIELKSGATVTTLSAFAENDPPVRAWFRK